MNDTRLLTFLSLFALALSTSLSVTPAQAQDQAAIPTAQVAQTASAEQNETVEEDTDRFIITFKDDNKTEQNAALNSVEAKTDQLNDLEVIKDSVATDKSIVVVKNDEALDPAEQQDAIKTLEADPRVESVEPDRIVYPLAAAASNEPLFTLQWALGTNYLNAPGAWDLGLSGTGQTVAIIDTGYSSHPDLKAPVAQYDFVSTNEYSLDGNGRDANASDPGLQGGMTNWHGTFVNGQIAAKVNGYGVSGIAYGADVVHARALGYKGGGNISDIADAITWSAGGAVTGVPNNTHPATVINASLAYKANQCTGVIKIAMDYAINKNIPVVVAAGNDAKNADNYSPANCYRAIVVGATNKSGALAYYSNYGSMLDVVAPGGDNNNPIYSTDNTGNSSVGMPSFGNKIGTSMAAPHVAATIALMKQMNPSLTIEQIRQALVSSGSSSLSGYKAVNVAAAVKAVNPYKVNATSGIGSAYYRGGGDAVYGQPLTNEYSLSNGGVAQRFSKGYTIYWHSTTGAYAVNFEGAIGAQFAAKNYENGYGFPASAEENIPGGAQQIFKTITGTSTALVWSSSTGVHTMNAQGAIYNYWRSRTQTLGFPTTDEVTGADGSITVSLSSGVQLRWSVQKGIQQIGFPDIKGDLFESQIKWIAERGITTGFNDGTYRPLANIQRAAMAAYFYRMAGSPDYTAPAVSPFKDVKPADQFYKEISWFAEQGITTGYSDGTFRPWDPVNRDAMAAFFYRYAGKPTFNAPAVSRFTDIKPGDQFYKEVSWLANSGITTGYGDKTYRPVTPIHRDAMAAFVYRYMN